MEESPSVQYYYSSGTRNPPPGYPATSEFFHHSSPHHAYHPFDAMPQPPPPPASTSSTYDLMAANLASSSSLHYFKNPASSSLSSGLINIAGYQDSAASLVPRYNVQDTSSCDTGREQLMIREMEYTTTTGGGGGGNGGTAMYHHDSSFQGGYNVGGGMVNHHQEGLSLSLASSISNNPQSEVNVAAHHFGEGYDHQYSSSYLQSKASNDNNVVMNDDQGMKLTSSNRSGDKSVVGASYVVRTTTTTTAMVGPLGPFTGYASILKSSRFLKPAQELLEEWCGLAGCSSSSKSRMDQVGDVLSDSGSGGGMSSSSAAFYGSNDGGDGSSGSQTYRPEFHEVKARLLYLLVEVCKRYKQYHQQMQMVVSSFESVAGLSSSTPYVSLAIKTISRNFKSMKQVISDQLKHARAKSVVAVAGEEELFSSSSSSTSTRLRSYMGQRQGCGGGPNHVGFLEPQQHVWRTQRGLPERSVAILRSWLFEHFLHPYPTDADKHMLATQAGLTRNQVSNWFINARVRVWKPMVEEIHMLESKGQAETSQSKGNNAAADAVANSTVMGPASVEEQGHLHHNHHQQLHREQYWKQEKRSRVDFQVPAAAMSNNSSLMNFLPYQQGSNGFDHQMAGGGNGAVSLTLGLRHGVVDNAAHQQQLQRHGDQLRRQFGGMRHEFVG